MESFDRIGWRPAIYGFDAAGNERYFQKKKRGLKEVARSTSDMISLRLLDAARRLTVREMIVAKGVDPVSKESNEQVSR